MSSATFAPSIGHNDFSNIADFRKVVQELEIAVLQPAAFLHLRKRDCIREALTKPENFDLNTVHRRAFAQCTAGLGGHPNVATTSFASVSNILCAGQVSPDMDAGAKYGKVKSCRCDIGR